MDHTTVVPVYWLGGAKVADSYNDFYDGSWDNDTNAKDRTENGTNELDLTLSGNEPWTGCEDDGTEAFSSSNVSQALGKDPARLGRPALSGAGNNPLSSNTVANRNTDHTMYGISAVFKIGAPRLPGRPTGLRATAISRSEIKLEWTAPTDTGDGDITQYKIEKSNDAGTTWSLLSDISSTHLTYTHTGLDQDTTRHYRVSARTRSWTRTLLQRGQRHHTLRASTADQPACKCQRHRKDKPVLESTLRPGFILHHGIPGRDVGQRTRLL